MASVAKCPLIPGFDLLSPDHLTGTGDELDRARRETPVFFIPDEDMWCVTRYDDVLAVMKDTATYSNAGADDVVAPRPPGFEHALPDGHPVSKSVHTLDPPEHTRVRKLAQKAFTPKHASARAPEIRSIADELIDAFIGRDEIDLVAEYSSQIPSRVISPIIGADPAVAQTLKRWTDDWFMMAGNRHLSMERNAELWRSAMEFEAFIRELVASRRADPQDDFTSDLLRATSDDGEPSLTDFEVVCVLGGVIAAGADTSNGLIASVIDCLLTAPEEWEKVKADPRLIPKAIEETLRLRCPVRGQRRVTTRATEIGGIPIPAGATVFIHQASANRDAEVFPNPNVFDMSRPNLSSHLGFGLGTHFCLGAPLARVEARVAIEALVDRVPGLSRVEGQQLNFTPSFYVPSLLELHVRLH